MRISPKTVLIAGLFSAAYALGAMHLSLDYSDNPVACGGGESKKKDEKKKDDRRG